MIFLVKNAISQIFFVLLESNFLHIVTHAGYEKEIFFEVYINDTGYVKLIDYNLYFTFLTNLSMRNTKIIPNNSLLLKRINSYE